MAAAERLHGFFSETSAKRNGYAVYVDAQGQEVRVTEVTAKVSRADSDLRLQRWPDTTYQGVVQSFVRTVAGPPIGFGLGRRTVGRR
jgi:hypothetical protein